MSEDRVRYDEFVLPLATPAIEAVTLDEWIEDWEEVEILLAASHYRLRVTDRMLASDPLALAAAQNLGSGSEGWAGE